MKRAVFFVSLAGSICLGSFAGPVRDWGVVSQAARAASDRPEIEKWKAYAAVAQRSDAFFAKQLWGYETHSRKDLTFANSIDSYFIVDPGEVSATADKLTATIPRSPSMPAIDEPASAFRDALRDFGPIDKELYDYGNSHQYRVDGGRKAREKDGAYVAALSAVVWTEAAFRASVQLQDEINAQLAFDASPDGSRDHFLAGVNLYRKQSVRLGKAVFSTRGASPAIGLFRTSLDDLGGMARAWDKAVRETRPEGCPASLKTIEDYLMGGRAVVQHAQDGAYKTEPGAEASALNAALELDAMTFDLAAEEMKKAFDRPPC